MEKTDKEALSAISIEDYTNPENADFRARLLEAISRMAITTNNTPEHNFLIGLAYLEGIDVEVDSKTAISIITESAEQGLEDAIEKLADMFSIGQGCFVDYKRSAFWRKKLVEQKYVTYQSSKDIYDASLLISALWELGECYFLSDEYEKALKTYNAMMMICGKNNNYLMQINAIMGIFRVYQAFRNFEKAKKSIIKHKKSVRNAFKNLSSEQSTYFCAQGITSGILEAIFAGLTGEIYLESKKLRKAEKWFRKQRGLLLKEQQHHNNYFVMFGLVENQLHLCQVLKRKFLLQKNDEKILADIKEKSEECIINIETIHSLYGEDLECEKSWFLACQFLGWVFEEKGLHDDAVKIYTTILQKQEQKIKQYPHYESENNLAVACDCLGRVLLKRGNPEQAKEHLEHSLALREPFDKTSDMKKNKICSLYYLGEAYKALDDFKSAMAVFQKTLDIGITLRQELQNSDWFDPVNLILLSGTCIDMAKIYIDNGNFVQAKKHLDLAGSFTSEPKSVFGESKGLYLAFLGFLYMQYGVLYTCMDHEEQALKYYLKSIHAFEQKQRTVLEESTYIHLACVYYSASILSKDKAAISYIKKAKECLDNRIKKFPNVEENVNCSEMVMQRSDDQT